MGSLHRRLIRHNLTNLRMPSTWHPPADLIPDSLKLYYVASQFLGKQSVKGIDPTWSYIDGADPTINDGFLSLCPAYSDELLTLPVAPEIVALTAQKYCLQVTGGGDVTCSYGTATEGNPLIFTATAGNTTFTPTSADKWMLTADGYVYPIIDNGTSTVSQASTSGGNGVGFELSDLIGITNIVPNSNTSLAFILNSNTVPPPTDNYALAPDNTNTAWLLPAGATGLLQRNITVEGSIDTYVWSLYIKSLTGVGMISLASLGFVGGYRFGTDATYDIGTDEFTSMDGCRREFLDDGWIRLSCIFENTGTLTTFVNKVIPSTTDSMLLWGCQLAKTTASNSTFLQYIENTSTSPVTVFSETYDEDPPELAVWGDSMAAFSSGWGGNLEDIYHGYPFYQGGVGGETSTEIKDRMIVDTERFEDVVLIHAGRNNFWIPEDVKSDIAEMVSKVTSGKFLVVSVFNGDNADEYIGESQYEVIMQLNADLEETYPNNYLDARSYIVSKYNPAIPQDVIDFGHDVSPYSLRGEDVIHLNDAGNELVAELIEQWLSAKGWMKTTLVNLTKGIELKGVFEGVDGNPAQGTVATLVRMGVGSGEISVGETFNVLTTDDTTTTQLYYGRDATGSYVACFDGTNTAKLYVDWDRGIDLIVPFKFDETVMQVGVYKVGIDSDITWSSETTFAGSFPVGDWLRLGMLNTVPLHLGTLETWNSIASNADIIKWGLKYV